MVEKILSDFDSDCSPRSECCLPPDRILRLWPHFQRVVDLFERYRDLKDIRIHYCLDPIYNEKFDKVEDVHCKIVMEEAEVDDIFDIRYDIQQIEGTKEVVYATLFVDGDEQEVQISLGEEGESFITFEELRDMLVSTV